MMTDVHSDTLELLWNTKGLNNITKKFKLHSAQASVLSDFTLFEYFEM